MIPVRIGRTSTRSQLVERKIACLSSAINLNCLPYIFSIHARELLAARIEGPGPRRDSKGGLNTPGVGGLVCPDDHPSIYLLIHCYIMTCLKSLLLVCRIMSPVVIMNHRLLDVRLTPHDDEAENFALAGLRQDH